jgi:hypothetical protein
LPTRAIRFQFSDHTRYEILRYEKWEKLGLDRVKSDLVNTGGIREVGGTPDVKDMAWEWVRMKENKPPLKPAVAGAWVLIAESRLDELRARVYRFNKT